MLKVKLMNKIAKVGTDVLSSTRYEVGDKVEGEDAVMVRSAALHEMPFSLFDKHYPLLAHPLALVHRFPHLISVLESLLQIVILC